MSKVQLYTVLLYAGDTLVNVKRGQTAEQAKATIEEWTDDETGRRVTTDPVLMFDPEDETGTNPLPVLPSALHLVTYVTDIGEINIVTNDAVIADSLVGALLHQVAGSTDNDYHVEKVVDTFPIHTVVIDDRIEYNSLRAKEIIESMIPVEVAETTDSE